MVVRNLEEVALEVVKEENKGILEKRVLVAKIWKRMMEDVYGNAVVESWSFMMFYNAYKDYGLPSEEDVMKVLRELLAQN